MRETSVPPDSAVSCCDYVPFVAYEDEYEALGRMIPKRRSRSTGREKPVLMTLCSPQIPQALAWNQTCIYYTATIYIINYHFWGKYGLNQECPSFLGANVRALMWADIYIYIYIHIYICIYTECNRRNGPDFGRVFLMLNYTEKPQNTYIQS